MFCSTAGTSSDIICGNRWEKRAWSGEGGVCRWAHTRHWQQSAPLTYSCASMRPVACSMLRLASASSSTVPLRLAACSSAYAATSPCISAGRFMMSAFSSEYDEVSTTSETMSCLWASESSATTSIVCCPW